MRVLVVASLLSSAASLQVGDPKEERVLMQSGSDLRECQGIKVPALHRRNVAFCNSLGHIKAGEKLITALAQIVEPLASGHATFDVVMAGGCDDVSGATAIRLNQLTSVKKVSIIDPSTENCKYMEKVVALNKFADLSFYDKAASKTSGARNLAVDTLFASGELDKAGLIYVDIDGSGSQAVSGMSRTLMAKRPILVTKVHVDKSAGSAKEARALMDTINRAEYNSYAMEKTCARDFLASCRTIIHVPKEAMVVNKIALEVTASKI